jgi:hypothetical protein
MKIPKPDKVRMCDNCEQYPVGLILEDRLISSHERLCLENDIIPSGTSVYFGNFRAISGEGKLFSLDLLGISIVLCKNCCLLDKDEIIPAVVKKPRILQEAIKSYEIWIKLKEQDVADSEKKKQSRIKELKSVNGEIQKDNDLLKKFQERKEMFSRELKNNPV